MLTSIDFHYQISLTAGEVCEIWADRELTDKLVAIQPPSTHFVPQPFLGIILDFPKLPGGLATFGSLLPRTALPLIRPSGTFSP
jgi:hypothetical protein